ncbi:hypothetical protein ACFQGT_00450 [Natrialbaceae archaeon GCM10025810]
MTRLRSIALAVVLIVSLVAVPGVAIADDEDDTDSVTDIGADHDLDTSDAITEYNEAGHTETDLSRIDMTVTVAESKADVGLEDQPLPTDVRNDYLRLQYDEEAERTVRILIPDDYWTPYLREEVQSISDDHTAEFEPVRGGSYTAVVIRFEEPADVVLPVQWDSSLSYEVTERIDERLNKSIGFQIRDDDTGWTYLEDENLSEGAGHEIDGAPGDVTVQYDATPDRPEETWINAPRGETLSDDIYYYDRGENGTTYVVSKTDEPPAVRYKEDSTFADRARGAINDLREVPNRIMDGFSGGGDLLG